MRLPASDQFSNSVPAADAAEAMTAKARAWVSLIGAAVRAQTYDASRSGSIRKRDSNRKLSAGETSRPEP